MSNIWKCPDPCNNINHDREPTCLACSRSRQDVNEETSIGIHASVPEGHSNTPEIQNYVNESKDCEYVEEPLTERIVIPYENDIKLDIEDDIRIILLEINKIRRKIPIYEKQEECSLSIVSKLQDRKIINIMVIALTQSGKTGTMCALLKNYLNHNIIPIENIYIITGLSSNEWVSQTKGRMPSSIHDRIFHLGNLSRGFIEDVESKKNVLIIMDEIQVAAKELQTIHKVFQSANFYDKEYLLKNDIKIVEFTATPDGTIYDLMNWGENACKIQMYPGNNYTSCFDLLVNGRIKQYKDLCCYDRSLKRVDEEKARENISELKNDIDRYDSPMHHIIRTPSGDSSNIVIENFKKYYDSELYFHKYDQSSEIKDINTLLEKPPIKHTFIFIKEKLRCAKTLTKTYLGVVYERYTNSPDDAVIIQGLVGRITGYNVNEKSICYTNIDTIMKYKKLWDSNFEDISVKWKSKTTKMKEDCLSSKGTYNFIPSNDDSSEDNTPEPDIMKFNTFEEVTTYYKDLKKDNPKFKHSRGPNKRTANGDGFYENTIRSRKKVMSESELHKERKWGLSTKHKYRLHTCYSDTSDKSTLEYWLIFYK